MKKNIALISVFAVLMIAFSGCVGNNTPAANGTGVDNKTSVANGTGSDISKANVISGENASEVSKIKNLPSGFEYVGSFSLSTNEIKSNYKAENVSGVLGGYEGLYKGSNNSSNNSDYYVDVIQFENKEAASNFISAYKSSFQPLNGSSPFVEESFNGHTATRITDYITEAGQTVPRYYYVWNSENYVLVVSGSTADNSLVKQLAEATGF
jgi:hypothetical protein